MFLAAFLATVNKNVNAQDVNTAGTPSINGPNRSVLYYQSKKLPKKETYILLLISAGLVASGLNLLVDWEKLTGAILKLIPETDRLSRENLSKIISRML